MAEKREMNGVQEEKKGGREGRGEGKLDWKRGSNITVWFNAEKHSMILEEIETNPPIEAVWNVFE